MAAEIRMNAEGAHLTLDEMTVFTTTARKYGVAGSTPVEVALVDGVAVFSLPVCLVHRTLTSVPGSAATPAMRGARRQRR